MGIIMMQKNNILKIYSFLFPQSYFLNYKVLCKMIPSIFYCAGMGWQHTKNVVGGN